MTVNRDESSGEVANSTPQVSDAALSELSSFDDALALINDVFGGAVVEADKELGTGFAVLEDKNRLIGVPMIAVKIDEHNGDHGPFVSLHVVTSDGRKYIVNDGSSGIYAQVVTLWERKPQYRGMPLMVRQGLRRSDYTHPEHGPSTTFYLNTSAAE